MSDKSLTEQMRITAHQALSMAAIIAEEGTKAALQKLASELILAARDLERTTVLVAPAEPNEEARTALTPKADT